MNGDAKGTETEGTETEGDGRVVVVTSGKGGVGKTTTAASLAYGLAEVTFWGCLRRGTPGRGWLKLPRCDSRVALGVLWGLLSGSIGLALQSTRVDVGNNCGNDLAFSAGFRLGQGLPFWYREARDNAKRNIESGVLNANVRERP